jgi:hypothetical protein
MGIDIHAFNFLALQTRSRPLGDVLTIGRQSLSLPSDYVVSRLGASVPSADGYCEPLLAAMGASSVASIDFSEYENPTHVGDLGSPLSLGRRFDTIVDSGSLEHVFDVVSAFRNCIGFCCVGGRIVHILPVNNLSGHGFWQFNSDLMFSLYSEQNGFRGTEVYYASGIDFSSWYRVPNASPGERIEAASVEPIVLLSVTEKFKDVEFLQVVQPFYAIAWSEGDASKVVSGPRTHRLLALFRTVLKRRGRFINLLRNMWFVCNLLSGRSRFSIRRFERVSTGHKAIR